jgi:hypothetical protein
MARAWTRVPSKVKLFLSLWHRPIPSSFSAPWKKLRYALPQSGKRGLNVSQASQFGQISRALAITALYTARYGVPPAGKKVYVQVNQFVNGWEDLSVSFWAIVPAAN